MTTIGLQSSRANTIFVSACLGIVGAYVSWVGSISSGLPWWLGYVILNGVVIGGTDQEDWRFFLVGVGVSVGTFLVVMGFHLIFAGFVTISGVRFELGKLGVSSWMRIGILTLATCVLMFFAAMFRSVIVGGLGRGWQWSEKTLTKMDNRIKLWGSVVAGLVAIVKTIVGAFG